MISYVVYSEALIHYRFVVKKNDLKVESLTSIASVVHVVEKIPSVFIKMDAASMISLINIYTFDISIHETEQHKH